MEREDAIKIVKGAYNKLSGIPDDQWVKGVFTDGKGACCMVGHMVRLESENPNDYSYYNCCDKLAKAKELHPIREAYRVASGSDDDIAEVNNGYADKYQQPTPKARVIAALVDSLCETVNNNVE